MNPLFSKEMLEAYQAEYGYLDPDTFNADDDFMLFYGVDASE